MKTSSSFTILGNITLCFSLLLSATLLNTAETITVNVPVFNHFTKSKDFAHGSRTLEVDWTATLASFIASEHVNARNGSLVPVLNESLMRSCPINFSLTYYDTRLNPRSTIKEAVTLLTSSSCYIVMSLDEEVTTEPLSFITSAFSMPLIASRATSSKFDNRENHPFFIRTALSDSVLVVALVEYLSQNSLTHVNLIYVEDVHGIGLFNLLFVAGESRGITFHAFPVGVGEAFEESLVSALSGMALSKLNVNIALVGEVGRLLQVAKQFGLTGAQKLWIFLEEFLKEDLKRYAEESEDFQSLFHGSIVFSPMSVDSVLHNDVWPYLADSIEEFQNNFGIQNATIASSVVNATLVTSAALAYDAVISMALGTCQLFAENTTSFLQSDFKLQLADTIRTRVRFQGLSGSIGFNSVGSRNAAGMAVKLSSYSFWVSAGEVILNITCGGLYNVTVGAWEYESITYPGGSSSPPRFTDAVVPYSHYTKLWELILMRTLAGVIFIGCALLLLWLYMCRKRSVVKATQPQLLMVMLFGIVISTNTVFPLSHDEGQGYTAEQLTASCNQVIWLLSSGVTLSSTAMICKLYRVIRIFNSFKPIMISVKKMLLAVFVLLLIDLGLVTAYEVLTPSHWVRETVLVDEYGQVTESKGSCKTVTHVLDVKVDLLWAIVAFHSVTYAVALYCCYLARNISSDFQDSQWVMTSIFSQLQLIALGVPVYFAVQGEPEVTFVLESLIILLFNIILIACMFLPKVIRTHAGPTEVSITASASKRTSVQTPAQSLKASAYSHDSPSSALQTGGQTKDSIQKRKSTAKVAPLEPTKEAGHEEVDQDLRL